MPQKDDEKQHTWASSQKTQRRLLQSDTAAPSKPAVAKPKSEGGSTAKMGKQSQEWQRKFEQREKARISQNPAARAAAKAAQPRKAKRR